MARITYSGLVSSINGSINGTTFQRNRYGHTIKGKPAMVKPCSAFQQIQKAEMVRVAQAWRNISDDDRQAWNSYAENNPRPSRLNPDAYLSGYNLFLLYNRFTGLLNANILLQPSNILGVLGAVDNYFLRDGSQLIWGGNPSVESGTWNALIFLTQTIPFGREFVNYTPRYITGLNWGTGFEQDITAQYIFKIGAVPEVGQWIGAKFVYYNTETAQVVISPNTQYEVVAA